MYCADGMQGAAASLGSALLVLAQPLPARLPEIVGLATELVENAHRLREALVAGDLAQVGACLSIYWNQKKSMAGALDTAIVVTRVLTLPGNAHTGGAEPAEVTAMIERLKADIYGCALGGAGGGGTS